MSEVVWSADLDQTGAGRSSTRLDPTQPGGSLYFQFSHCSGSKSHWDVCPGVQATASLRLACQSSWMGCPPCLVSVD